MQHYENRPDRANQAARLIAGAHRYSNMRVSVETMRDTFGSINPGKVMITYTVWDDDDGESIVETVTLHQEDWNRMVAAEIAATLALQ